VETRPTSLRIEEFESASQHQQRKFKSMS